MDLALIVSNTLKGATTAIGNLIAEGLTLSGVEAEVRDASKIEQESDLADYDAYIFGSATYHGEMLPDMKRMLFLAEKARLKGKVGGAFGAFGWSGEAPDRIFKTMLNILGMKMVGGPLRLKSAEETEGPEKAKEYGRLIAQKLREQTSGPTPR